jgi:hypothetical protein
MNWFETKDHLLIQKFQFEEKISDPDLSENLPIFHRKLGTEGGLGRQINANHKSNKGIK